MSKERILVVDDQEEILHMMSRMLKRKGFDVETVNTPTKALEAVVSFRPDLVLSDIQMPEMSGVELARRVRKDHPDTSIIIMTAYAEVETAIESLKLGVDDYIRKPFTWDQAIASIRAALDKRTTTVNNKKYVDQLGRKLMQQRRRPAVVFLGGMKDLYAAEGAARSAALDTVESLAVAMGVKDPLTKDHSRKVGAFVAAMGAHLSFSPEEVRQLRLAGLLHDVGKIGMPDETLSKLPEDMTKAELEQYKEHPIISHRILQPVREFQPILNAVLHHHERYDGKGFPDRLSGVNIPIGARMIAVADVFSYLIAGDPADEAARRAAAEDHLLTERGTRFDPEMVDAFLKVLKSGQA